MNRLKHIRQRYQWLLMIIGALLTIAFGTALYYGRSYVQQKTMDKAVTSLKAVVRDAFVMVNQIQTAADGISRSSNTIWTTPIRCLPIAVRFCRTILL